VWHADGVFQLSEGDFGRWSHWGFGPEDHFQFVAVENAQSRLTQMQMIKNDGRDTPV